MWASTKNIRTHSWALHSLVVESGSFELWIPEMYPNARSDSRATTPCLDNPKWGIMCGNEEEIFDTADKRSNHELSWTKKAGNKNFRKASPVTSRLAPSHQSEIPRSKFTAERCWKSVSFIAGPTENCNRTALLYGYVISMARFFGIKCIQMQHAPHMMVPYASNTYAIHML